MGDAGATAQAQAQADALCRWLEDRHGGPVTLAEPVTSKGEGFDSDIVLLRVGGPTLPAEWRQPLVLRVKSDAGRLEEAHREAAIQSWAADRGYPAPRVLVVLEPGEVVDRPAQVMERAPGSLMLDHLRRAPWAAGSLVHRLASLHVRLHQLPVDGFPAGDDLLDRRLRLTRHTAGALDHAGLRAGLERVTALASQLRDGPVSVCHGDFHPLNVFVSDGSGTVIDWTDAGVGDRHGDVSRTLLLFELAAIAAGNGAERVALRLAGPRLGRAYRRAYDRVLPLDARRLDRWTPVHLLHGWSQAVALHAGLFDRAGEAGDTDDRRERVPAAMVDELRRRFDAALAVAPS